MGQLNLFLSSLGGLYLVLFIADRVLSAKRKKSDRHSLKKVQYLVSIIALAIGAAYFIIALFSKSLGLLTLGFLMIAFSSGRSKMLKG